MRGWAWSAEYQRDLTWQFSVSLEAMHPEDPRKTLGQWFLAMAAAFGETKLDAGTAQTIDVTNAVSAAYADIIQKIQNGVIQAPTEETAKSS